MRRQRGFTLIELLIAATVSTLVLGGLFTCLMLTTNAWRRIQTLPQLEVGIALEKFGTHCTRGVVFSEIPFVGESRRVAFPAVVNVANVEEEPRYSLGQVEYFIDGDSLCMRSLSYGEAIAGGSGVVQCLVSGVRDMEMSYYYIDTNQKISNWEPVWDPDIHGAYPWAIRMTLTVEDLIGKQISFTKSAICAAYEQSV